ncbi:MAG TPA: helix-turn-helix domain-containing protein [Solirubrobacteraceae bacterium]|nr:helix-turn-helix domain-containing protein [Solirubrobacteraceae bacterium]
MSSPHAGDLTELLLERLARRIVELQQELAPPPETDGERSPWMNIETAAAYLDWPKQRLYKLTAEGAIPHFKHDGRLLFNRPELDQWLRHYAQPHTTG